MKKVLIAVLTLTMLLAIAVTASAAKSNYTIYNMPCEAIADNMLYQYHADTKNSVQPYCCADQCRRDESHCRIRLHYL